MHNSQLDPKFLTGFVDGEGSFIVGFFANNKYKNGYQIQLIFKISLHNKYFELLSQIQSYFGFTLFFFCFAANNGAASFFTFRIMSSLFFFFQKK